MPQLIGRYLIDEAPVPWSLALRFVPLEDDEREPESFAVVDQTDSSMLISVRDTDGTDEKHTIRLALAVDGAIVARLDEV